MIILNNISLMSVVVQVLESLKSVNGFDDTIYNILNDHDVYVELLKEVHNDVGKALLINPTNDILLEMKPFKHV